jgi:aryl-alcohol dehydrogenase-like predicted oxidoreductase
MTLGDQGFWKVMDKKKISGSGQSRYHLMNDLDAGLKRLQLAHIDLYLLHGFDPVTPPEEVLSTLNNMVCSGKVRHIGLCNMAAWQITVDGTGLANFGGRKQTAAGISGVDAGAASSVPR